MLHPLLKSTTTTTDILQEFTQYIQQIGYSKSSQYQIPKAIKEFLRYAAEPNIKKIKQNDILNFYNYLQNRPHKRKETVLSETFVNQHMYALKVFFNWLEQTQQIKTNPISNLKFKRPKANPREPLSQKEVTQLFESAITAKETAILHLFYSCGLRRTEAENLNTSDIHFTQNLLYVREGKGAKRRAIPITETVKRDLESYLLDTRTQIQETRQGADKEPFMTNIRGKRMKGDSYNDALKKLVAKSQISSLNTQISLHHLRHSIATHLLENGLSIEFVRDFLGHSHLEATQIYAKVFKHQLKNL